MLEQYCHDQWGEGWVDSVEGVEREKEKEKEKEKKNKGHSVRISTLVHTRQCHV